MESTREVGRREFLRRLLGAAAVGGAMVLTTGAAMACGEEKPCSPEPPDEPTDDHTLTPKPSKPSGA